ncbi:MAG: signal peptidase I [Elusimicrobiota bacterium]
MTELIRLLKLIAIALAVVLPVRTWVAEPVYVASPSMEPALRTGTLMILDKFTLRMRPPQRGDIVSFRSPVDEHDLLKRVVALPGETVEMRGKIVFINGKELDEPYAVHSRSGERLQGDDMGPLIVPENGFFVLGDNRDESNDSSVWKDAEGNPVRFLRLKLIQGIVRRLPWA